MTAGSGIRRLSIQVIVLLFYSAAACAQEEGLTLDQKLEGLGPKPRISYLRYVIGEEGPGSEIYFHLGVAFHELGRTDSAAHYYQKAVAEDSTMFKAYVNMGIIYDDRNIMSRAVEYYEKALDIRPGDVIANTQLGSLYQRNDIYEMGIRYIRRALEANPSHPQPHYYLGVFFADCGIYGEAIREWEKVIDLASGGNLADRAEKNIETLRDAISSTSLADSLEMKIR